MIKKPVSKYLPYSTGSIAALFFIAGILFSSSVLSNDKNAYIGIKRFSISSPAMKYYQSLDVLLYQRLNFEVLPHGILPLLVGDSTGSDCIAMVSGSIEIIDSLPFLIFSIDRTGSNTHEVESKTIPLDNQPVEAIVDVMSLKIHHFLEQNISGKVHITSSPIDCNLYLNGVKIGNSPAELTLEQGIYAIRLQREYFLPFKDSISVFPGRETRVAANMQFKGRILKPWIVSASILSVCTIVLQITESYFQSAYQSLGAEDGELFEPYFNRYKTANYLKVTFSIPTITTWTIALSHYFENKALKKQIFSE